MYGGSVYRHFRYYWNYYLMALRSLVSLRGAALTELNMEAPVRCLGRGVITR